MTTQNLETVSSMQAAAALGCTRQAVSYLVKRGRIEASRDYMGRLRVSLPSVVNYAATSPRRRRTGQAA